MLNIEQILIKTAQYFDFDLTKLHIKETKEKHRLYTHQSQYENIEHIKDKIFKKITELKFNHNLKKIFDEFQECYAYISQELHNRTDKNEEKEIDWFLLKHFVVPFFAVRISQEFSTYNHRIDIGLRGSDFWYLPSFDTDTKKIKFPLNKVMDWFIDLYGGSNQDFYVNRHCETSYDENPIGFDIKEGTLKKWHKQFVLPKYKNIKAFSAYKFNYKGIIEIDEALSLEERLSLTMQFITSKSLDPERLRLEIPDFNNLIDKAYENNISHIEKEKFILYITQRWAKPSTEQLKSILLVARVSQACYKDLLEYFKISIKTKSYEENCILQLIDFFCVIYNLIIGSKKNPIPDFYQPYLYKILLLKEDKREALDCIVSKILFDLHHPISRFRVDEILLGRANNKKDIEVALRNLKNEILLHKKQEKMREDIYLGLEFINRSTNEEEILRYIYSIKEPFVLRNLGDYFAGDNYLTDEPPNVNIRIAWHIRIFIYENFNDFIEKRTAYSGIINLLTFSYYPRLLAEGGVKEWLQQEVHFFDRKKSRERRILLGYHIYHEINKQNNQEVIELVEIYIEKTKDLKPQEYNPQPLFVAQRYMKYIKNMVLYNKLQKINQKNLQYNELIKDDTFYFYE